MKDKLEALSKINSDVEYLSQEYDTFKLGGSCPDGDVEFYTLLKWLTKHKHEVEHMIEVGELINNLGEK